MTNNQPWWKNSRGEWYVVLQLFLFVLVALGPRQMTGLPTWSPPWSTIGLVVGFVIVAFGLGILMFGTVSLGTNLTALPYPKDGSQFVESGAYRLVRHPIYSGLIFGAVGWAMIRASTLTLIYALILFIFFEIKSRQEEKWLATKFAGYAAYQMRVRKLIPFVY